MENPDRTAPGRCRRWFQILHSSRPPAVAGLPRRRGGGGSGGNGCCPCGHERVCSVVTRCLARSGQRRADADGLALSPSSLIARDGCVSPPGWLVMWSVCRWRSTRPATRVEMGRQAKHGIHVVLDQQHRGAAFRWVVRASTMRRFLSGPMPAHDSSSSSSELGTQARASALPAGAPPCDRSPVSLEQALAQAHAPRPPGGLVGGGGARKAKAHLGLATARGCVPHRQARKDAGDLNERTSPGAPAGAMGRG